MKKNLVFLISEACNHDCVYCIRQEKDKKTLFSGNFLNPDKNNILKHLNLYKGFTDEISLTGGEPLLNSQLADIIQLAIDNGIKKINIHTNGALLGRQDLVDLFTKYKNHLKLVVSLPSTDREVFKQISQADNLAAIMNNLEEYWVRGFDLHLNIVVSKLNLDSLKQSVIDLTALGFKNLQLLGIDTYNKDYNIEYAQSLPVLDEIVGQFSDRIGFKLYAMPKCVFRNFKHLAGIYQIKANRATYNELTIGSKSLLLKTDYLKLSRKKIKACKLCGYSSNCEGILKSYLGLYGENEFKPF